MVDTHNQKVLKLKTSIENEMLVKSMVPGDFAISKPSIAVLVWVIKHKYDEEMIEPNLVAHPSLSTGPKSIQVRMRRINEGMNIYLSQGDGLLSSSNWSLRSSIGIIPPGNYSFSLWLKCNKGQTLIYDEFRLFLVELADVNREKT